MRYKRHSSDTCKIGVLIVFFCQIAFSGGFLLELPSVKAHLINSRDPHEITTAIKRDLVRIVSEQEAKFLNIVWPDSFTIASNRIRISNKQDSLILSNSLLWVRSFLTPLFYNLIDSVTVLVNMRNGDDWVVGNTHRTNQYFQFIDGRSLTILLVSIPNPRIAFTDTILLKENLTKAYSGFVDFISLGPLSTFSINFEDITESYVSGFFDNTASPPYSKLPFSGFRPKFWATANCLIVDFPKVLYPRRDLFGFDAIRTIGGISPIDKRAFIRFGVKNRIDFWTEMLTIFPWVKDSLRILNCQSEVIQKEYNTSDPAPISIEENLSRQLRKLKK